MSNADSPVNSAGIQAPAWSVARWLAVNLRGDKVDAMVDNCAACHRADGKAAGDVFPALPGNPTVLQEDPASLIRVILATWAYRASHGACRMKRLRNW